MKKKLNIIKDKQPPEDIDKDDKSYNLLEDKEIKRILKPVQYFEQENLYKFKEEDQMTLKNLQDMLDTEH